MDLTPLLDKWIGYADAAVIAIIGQIGMQGYYWHVGQRTGCTVRRVLAWMSTAAAMGMMCKSMIPVWFPASDAVIFGAGMSCMVLMSRLRVTMPAWIVRLARGSGSPFDDTP